MIRHEPKSTSIIIQKESSSYYFFINFIQIKNTFLMT